MLQAACEPFLKIGVTPMVVTGFSAGEVEQLARELGVPFVRNQTPSDGMQSSIRVGLTAVESEVRLVFVHPVDCPGVASGTLEMLVSVLETCGEALAAKPVWRSRGGHPVLLRRDACTMFIDSGGRLNLRQFLASLGTRVLIVETEDRAVVRDIDTTEDIRVWAQESIQR
jgi:molybdenum cofactor cytidylyltransferase